MVKQAYHTDETKDGQYYSAAKRENRVVRNQYSFNTQNQPMMSDIRKSLSKKKATTKDMRGQKKDYTNTGKLTSKKLDNSFKMAENRVYGSSKTKIRDNKFKSPLIPISKTFL